MLIWENWRRKTYTTDCQIGTLIPIRKKFHSKVESGAECVFLWRDTLKLKLAVERRLGFKSVEVNVHPPLFLFPKIVVNFPLSPDPWLNFKKGKGEVKGMLDGEYSKKKGEMVALTSLQRTYDSRLADRFNFAAFASVEVQIEGEKASFGKLGKFWKVITRWQESLNFPNLNLESICSFYRPL